MRNKLNNWWNTPITNGALVKRALWDWAAAVAVTLAFIGWCYGVHTKIANAFRKIKKFFVHEEIPGQEFEI